MCIDYFLEYVFIRRAEGIVFYLLRRYPFESAMFEQLRRALGYFCVEHDEMDIYIGILMVGIAEFVAVADYCSRAVVYCFLNCFGEIFCAALRRSVIFAVNAVIGGVAPDAVPHGGII